MAKTEMAELGIVEISQRMRAMRSLVSAHPRASAIQRLAEIHDLSDPKIPFVARRSRTSPDLQERLEAGQKSRSPRISSGKKSEPKKEEADEEEDAKKKRKRKGDRDRSERAGMNRSTDVNA